MQQKLPPRPRPKFEKATLVRIETGKVGEYLLTERGAVYDLDSLTKAGEISFTKRSLGYIVPNYWPFWRNERQGVVETPHYGENYARFSPARELVALDVRHVLYVLMGELRDAEKRVTDAKNAVIAVYLTAKEVVQDAPL